LPNSDTPPDEKGFAKRKQRPATTFEDLARQRKLLQEFCSLHVPSLEYYICDSFSIFKLSDEEPTPTEFKHITSSATCYESIDACPDKFRPKRKKKDSRDFAGLGRKFAQEAIKLSVTEKWKSDGAAGIYCSCRGLPYIVSQLDDWHSQIDQHLARIFYQMDEDPSRLAIGEADKAEKEEDRPKEQKSWYKPNAYHTYWTLELLRILELPRFAKACKESKKMQEALARRAQLRQWARQQLGVQVALHSADSSVLDSDQLAWSLAILISQPPNYQSTLAEQDLIRQAFKCLFSTQEQVGTWRHYAPLFHYPHAGNAYCYVFETFATILREALRPEAEFVRTVLKQYFIPLVQLWQYATSTQTKHDKEQLAWSSGHRNKPAPESWATASVFAYAQTLRKLLGTWTREEALTTLNYRPTMPAEEAQRELVKRSEIWTCADLADRLWSMFISPVSSDRIRNEPDPDQPLIGDRSPRSAILFGPPGTSKTYLVRALAGAIGWKYIELHPSHFVAEGLPNVQHTADVIFQKLMELDRAVVLFDEIDELVRERDIEPDQFGRFLTTSMLPRLAELWKGRKVMYFVATNHIGYFDRAVTRSERFDAIICISPPSFAAKEKELLRILKDTYLAEPTLAPDVTKDAVEKAMPRKRCKNLEQETDKGKRDRIGAERLPKDCVLAKFALIRWDELHDLALHLEASMEGEKVVSKQALENGLARIKDGRSRSLVEYCRFRSDLEDYEHFDTSRNARWIVSDIEGFVGSAAELPPPIHEEDGVRVVDAPVGPVGNVKVPGYIVEKTGSGSAPGHIRLRKPPQLERG